MELINVLLLAVVQGVTEWLPISSSAHLAILNSILGITEESIFYTIMLHFTTAIVVLVLFRDDVLDILRAFFKFDFKSYAGKKALFLIIATIPASVAGFLLYSLFEKVFFSLQIIAILLVINGIFLLFVEKWPGIKKLNFKNTLLMGLIQVIAIFPGISRSGATIGIGLLSGIKKEEAAKFSFLMSIPLLIGAGLYELISKPLTFNLSLLPLIFGIFTVSVTTYFSIKLLLKILNQKKFWYFGIYCMILGIILFSLNLIL